MSVDMAHQHQAIPFFLLDGELSVAMAQFDPESLEVIAHSTGCRINLHIAPLSQIMDAIDIQYFDDIRRIEQVQVEGLHVSVTRGNESDEIRHLSNSLVASAVKERASDIHIEPEEGFARVRFRVDGILREEKRLPIEIHHHLVTRFKVMAAMNISETRRPQDGRIRMVLGQRAFDIRMSVVPSKGSEKIVLRILDRTGLVLDIERMYLSESIQQRVRKVISASSGLILVTGPTGSGKTTFCYAVVNELNTMERNIVTIEDPVEYRFPIVTQIQVHQEIGISFATVLRSVLRQDPNVIFVGEIRDLETARVVTEAALTGHLVLSTMHTNNSVQAVIRMVEIGVEPFMVAPSIEGVLGQRLVRRICPHCRISYIPEGDERLPFRLSSEEGGKLVLYRGRGCEICHGTGYIGRLGIQELVMVTDEIRDMILKGSSMLDLERAAARGGYHSMRYDGLKKAILGLTTLEEVQRVTLDRDELVV
jgi:type IV pilus assembly protein PilB